MPIHHGENPARTADSAAARIDSPTMIRGLGMMSTYQPINLSTYQPIGLATCLAEPLRNDSNSGNESMGQPNKTVGLMREFKALG